MSGEEERSQFVQYLFLRVDPQWRRLTPGTRSKGSAEFARTVCDTIMLGSPPRMGSGRMLTFGLSCQLPDQNPEILDFELIW